MDSSWNKANVIIPSIRSIASLDNLRRSWFQVRQNRGAPGIDGITVQAFESRVGDRLDAMAKTLIVCCYRPSPMRAVEILKHDAAGTRTLGIPTVQDRVVLQAITQILSPLWEPHFSPFSFAYREGRTALDAVLLAQQRLQSGQHWIVDLDIEKFFDNVDHVRLMQRLAQRVIDAELLDLIADFLRAGLMREGVRYPTRVGIPQGSPLSPLLANIVLDELDQEYMSHGWSFVRYADDCILLAKSEPEACALLEFTREFLADRLHLHLHPAKTRIVQPADVGFLGFTYRLSRYGKVSRRITRNALAAFRARIAELTRVHPRQSLEEVFERVGDFFRGWTTYYSFTQDNTLLAARAFACDALRAVAWEHWRSPQERFRQLHRLGVSEEEARRAAFALDFPGPEDDPPILRRVLPDSFFERYGLRIQRPQHREISEQPLRHALAVSSVSSQQHLPARSAQSASASTSHSSLDHRARQILFAFIARRLHIGPSPSNPDFEI